MDSKDCSFTVNLAPQQILAEAEDNLKKTFRRNVDKQIDSFFHTSGAGSLLIHEWLEKKFDDPKTLEQMEKYFTANFDRIMEGAMQKAMEHQAKKFAFTKPTKDE